MISGLSHAWFAYLLNATWQLPVLFLSAWLAARLLRPLGPAIEHRIWVAALLVQTILPAIDLRLLPGVPWPFRGAELGSTVQVAFGAGQTGGSSSHFGALLFVTVLVLHAGWLLFASVRLLWGLRRVHALAREATLLELTGDAAAIWTRLCQQFAIVEQPLPATSADISGPVMLGLRRARLLFPEGFLAPLSAAELAATFAHEFAHCVRRDALRQVLYTILSLPLGWHPAVRRALAELAATREMVCDSIAAEATGGSKVYARSLVRIAAALRGGSPAAGLPAIGFLDPNTLERRIMLQQQLRERAAE